ncbi:virginiamycin B lyase family protein [Kribbella solani]|uniref:Virginiamycin B lyase n=1 Tax=Kribbella solani TaxID=236067 RepID=A0A841E405_9ACTN|nr:virginiamycin B lyase [Kribbella solani]MBB5982078.1 virginiamycin B lyase [Kribbella solani]
MSVREYVVGAAGDGPYGVVVAGDEVWTTLVHAGRVATRSGRVVELGAPESRPSVIVTSPDGAIWFTRNGDDQVGRITPAESESGGEAPDASAGSAGVSASSAGVSAGSAGVSASSAGVSAVEVVGAPYGLCVGPDEALWCTLMSGDAIGRITTDGEVSTYPVGTTGAFPAMITSFAGELWFTLNQANAIGRMTTAGDVTTYPLPTDSAGPVGISAGPDAVWFTELLADRAGRIAADGTIQEFALPAGSKPHAAAATPDGGCWITLWSAAKLVRLDADGNVTREYALGDGAEPHGLAIAPDGSVWVALEKGSLAHIQPDG